VIRDTGACGQHTRKLDCGTRRNALTSSLASWLPRFTAPLELHMSDKAKLLRVLIATPLGFRGRGGIDRQNDFIIERVNNSSEFHIRVERLVTRGNGSIIWSPIFLIVGVIQLTIAACRRDVDLLHISLALKGSLYRKLIVAAFSRICKVPYLIHVHGAGLEEFWPSRGHLLRNATDNMFNESAAIIVLNSFWLKFISNRLPECKNKIYLLPNATPAVPAGPDRSADAPVQISFLGELGRRKGTPQLVAALAMLTSCLDWKTTIAGDGDIEGTRHEVQALNLANRVDIPGWLNSVQVAELLRRTDVLVLPSFDEILPMSILEAFSYGIPVVTTPVGAIPDAVQNGRNGLLVPPGDVGALANALKCLIDNPDMRRRLGAAARQDHQARFEVGAYVDRLIEIWREVTGTPDARHGHSARSLLR
jgi:glycosyltransferase involved in cell wall biosynthesis